MVHAQIGIWVITLSFSLLPGATKAIHTQAFTILRHNLSLLPSTDHPKKTYPTPTPTPTLLMLTRTRSHWMQRKSPLAFLKPEHTVQGYKVLSNYPDIVKHTNSRPLPEYFEPQWIGKVATQRGSKARAKAYWDLYWTAINGELKMSSALQAYHRHLRPSFGVHSKFSTFLLLQH
ncbi:hypothetical protein DSO57_1005603 [Entomophthora muscae]|uniref:Uncharacterized protein n=1 Tax=Entomophthora muscae TaxID=34485 RepID=A0ACC2RMI9_9FUNG|nr:hypothetical protein DSO57_1005603 [Entomophthora muscae]